MCYILIREVYISFLPGRAERINIWQLTGKGAFIMIKTVTLDRNQKPTDEQIKMIRKAAEKEIIYDEDSPEMTPAMEKAFRLAAKNRNTMNKISVS